MKQTIKVERFENKVSKNNKRYGKVNGKYSVFEKNLMDTLEHGEGKVFDLEIVENGDFFNIREIYGEGESNEVPVEVVSPTKKVPKETKGGYHLTPESCRVEALKCAMKLLEISGTKVTGAPVVIGLADRFLKYIEG